jgi:hypothetical protein
VIEEREVKERQTALEQSPLSGEESKGSAPKEEDKLPPEASADPALSLREAIGSDDDTPFDERRQP